MTSGHAMSPPQATPAERANELLGRMTLTEKSRQVSALMPHALLGAAGLDQESMVRHLGDGIGHISNLGFIASGPREAAGLANALQRFLVENTRLGIPAMIHAEALNGLVLPGFTSFPTPIALAATWDPDRIRAMAEVIRRQMRSVGIRHALSPVMDIARDARWGRVHETYGEDVYLASAMSVAFVQGLQGENLAEGVLATGKHFLGYALTEGGQNMASTHLGSRELYDVYATPFEAAIRLAGLRSVMNSYAEVDGVPAGASRALLTDLLRVRMGFQGSVVSDYSTVPWLHSRQRVASSTAEAGILAISAGLDVELPSIDGYGDNLIDAVTSGRLDEAVLDDAVRRVLTDKFSVGLFDSPYAPEDGEAITITASAGRELSRDLADEAITLLRNDGILPLARDARIAVIGPNASAAIVNFAAYTVPAQVDMVKGIATGESRMAGVDALQDMPPELADAMAERRARLLSADGEQVARSAYGALALADAIREAAPQAVVTAAEGVAIYPDGPRDIEAAVGAARYADVVVLALGGRAGWFGTRITEGEGTDAASVELPRAQVELAEAVAATGTPLVGVVYQGRPHALAEVDHLLRALLIAYYPGPEGPRSVAGVLFGDVNPSGRLPYSLPRATGQVPLYYSQHHGSGYRRGGGDMFRKYIDLEATPLYPFGHGIGFSDFTYGQLSLSTAEAPADGGSVQLSATVSNTSQQAGTTVVQFYASGTATGVTRPALQLIGFHRISLEAGETATVTCELQLSQLGYSGSDGRFILEAGPVELFVGASSGDLRSRATLTVTGPTALLEGHRAFLSTSAAARVR